MARSYRGYESGHSPGGIDVTEAVNLAFKGILLSPIFILCIFITLAMLKHMLFGGIPHMIQPTQQQREALQERDATQEYVQPEAVEVREEVLRPGGRVEAEALGRKPEVIPYTIYDRKSQIPEEPATWNTEIQEDPFQ